VTSLTVEELNRGEGGLKVAGGGMASTMTDRRAGPEGVGC
jgi:hypothetical protein